VLPLDPDALSDEALLLRGRLSALVEGPTPEEEARGITSFFSAETAGILQAVELWETRPWWTFRPPAPDPNASSSAGSFFFSPS
jgi:hypothetical protein